MNKPNLIQEKKRVLVAMSGGVDSSVAAYLLKKSGYDVVGAYMRSYNLDGCAERDAEDARRVAEFLGIPFYTFNFEQEYKERVVDYMIKSYKNGLTPNPDVMCNKEIKFGLFLERAIVLGFDFMATGHYARLRFVGMKDKDKRYRHGRLVLCTAKDKNKDQTYFLWTLGSRALSRCLFPVGSYVKSEVRKIARAAGLPTADKKDSQGICFLGDVSMENFLKEYITPKAGVVIDTKGVILGSHFGAYYYTIGQRHGLNLGAKGKLSGIQGRKNLKPHYVARKDVKKNLLTVAEGESNQALFTSRVLLKNVVFQSYKWNKNAGKEKSFEKIKIFARMRYRAPVADAVLSYNGKNHVLDFIKPQRAIARGQSAVFYNAHGTVLGGGVISIVM